MASGGNFESTLFDDAAEGHDATPGRMLNVMDSAAPKSGIGLRCRRQSRLIVSASSDGPAGKKYLVGRTVPDPLEGV
jgi:hypothetical protein